MKISYRFDFKKVCVLSLFCLSPGLFAGEPPLTLEEIRGQNKDVGAAILIHPNFKIEPVPASEIEMESLRVGSYRFNSNCTFYPPGASLERIRRERLGYIAFFNKVSIPEGDAHVSPLKDKVNLIGQKEFGVLYTDSNFHVDRDFIIGPLLVMKETGGSFQIEELDEIFQSTETTFQELLDHHFPPSFAENAIASIKEDFKNPKKAVLWLIVFAALLENCYYSLHGY